MNGEKTPLFVLWIKSLFITAGALRVSIEPKPVVVKHVNESLEIVCKVKDCAGEATFTWKTLIDDSVGGTFKSNGTTSLRTYARLTTEDQRTVICTVMCGEAKTQAQTKIVVYSLPSDPVLSRVNDSMLMCMAHRVYSPKMFQLDWLCGDTLIHHETFSDKHTVEDITFFYTPSEQDLGRNITCRVSMNLSETPYIQKTSSVTTQYGPAFMTISNNTNVKLGKQLELRCDADEMSSITWKNLNKSDTTILSRDRVLVIENVTWFNAGQYECEARAGLASRRSRVRVTVEGPPNVPQIRLSQAANPKAGDNITLFCDSDSLPEVRLRISGPSLNQAEIQSSSVSVNIPSVELKDSGLYLCEAQTAFGSRQSSFNITVQAPPRNSTVLVEPSVHVMEAQNITISCSTASFPPASITLRRKNVGLETVSPNGIFYLVNLKSEDKGTYIVNFTNEHGYEVKTFELVVNEQSTIMPIVPKAVIPAVSSVSLLTIAALIIRHLRKVKKGSTGFNLGDALNI